MNTGLIESTDPVIDGLMIRHFLITAAVVSSSPALAQPSTSGSSSGQQQSAPIETTAASEPEDTRSVCRSIYQTNSRIPERVCRTRAQWDEIQRQSREALERNRRGSGASGDGG